MIKLPSVDCWHLDVDQYLNPLLPRKRLDLLPKPISHFLGHRSGAPKAVGNVIIAFWALVGALVGVVVIATVFMIPEIQDLKPPIVIASFGAAAVLEYNAIDSPFAQPRNSIFGHVICTIIGVSVTKLFKLNPNFENIRWLSGGMACGLSSSVMALTGTIYPPAGATALLASVDPQTERLGWYLLPLITLSSILILVTSLLVNNIQRRFPIYWWTKVELNPKQESSDVEKGSSCSQKSQETLCGPTECDANGAISVTDRHIDIPGQMVLSDDEMRVLQTLQDRMRRKASPACASAQE